MRLQKTIERWEDNAPEAILRPQALQPPRTITDPALWIRMLFSSLVDADFLDTEAFFDTTQSQMRGNYPGIQTLLDTFNHYMRSLEKNASDTHVNRLRKNVLQQSIAFASRESGIYTLTVPTGGGKTLSSMAYALHHARAHGKRRIIYVIPYTSIIEQNAQVYRNIFGDAVIEHHSQFALDDESPEMARTKLASENWDAPIIVTTTVQFFESLFANKPSRCRKLHNIAESVVIIDEVQTLPIPYLQAITDKINALNKDYATTFLLCSATLPSFESFALPESTFYGLNIKDEIVVDPEILSKSLRRTHIEWEHTTPKSYDKLAEEIIDGNLSALAVVNTRDRARKLYDALLAYDLPLFHLSANMCGEHRSRIIKEIRIHLQQKEHIIVVSTNLIEAGVDLDFPLLWRELAGLDNIAQAAGRCNREGKLPKPGTVTIFTLAEGSTPRYLQPAINALNDIYPDLDDPLSPEAFHRYFATLYKQAGSNLDQKGIAKREIDDSRQFKWRFATTATDFQMIEDGYTQSVLIPYDEKARQWIDNLGIETITRQLLRKLQRYSINLPNPVVERLLREREIIEVLSGIFILQNTHLYTESTGFDESKIGIMDADSIII